LLASLSIRPEKAFKNLLFFKVFFLAIVGEKMCFQSNNPLLTSSVDIVESVRRPSQSGKSPLRPMVDEECAEDEEIIKMMTKCWSEDPLDRPDFSALKVAIRKLNK